MLLLHYNSPVHKCNITQAATQYTGFIELNHPTYSPDLAASDYHLFSNLKNFLCGRDFENDDEAIMTVNHYLERLDCDFFSRSIESRRDRWIGVIVSQGEYIE